MGSSSSHFKSQQIICQMRFNKVNGYCLLVNGYCLLVNGYCTGDALEDTGDTLLYNGRRGVPVGHPDEGQGHSLPVGEGIGQQLLVLAESFAQLALHAVAVYGMLETALRHTEQQLQLGCAG